MKIFAKFGPGVLIPVLCVALGIAGAAMAPSCATIQKVATDVATSAGNPDSAVGAIVANVPNSRQHSYCYNKRNNFQDCGSEEGGARHFVRHSRPCKPGEQEGGKHRSNYSSDAG